MMYVIIKIGYLSIVVEYVIFVSLLFNFVEIK